MSTWCREASLATHSRLHPLLQRDSCRHSSHRCPSAVFRERQSPSCCRVPRRSDRTGSPELATWSARNTILFREAATAVLPETESFRQELRRRRLLRHNALRHKRATHDRHRLWYECRDHFPAATNVEHRPAKIDGRPLEVDVRAQYPDAPDTTP